MSVSKNFFIVHSKKMFNVSYVSYIQYPSFWEQILNKLVIMNEHLLPWRRKKKIHDFSITFSAGYYRKI